MRRKIKCYDNVAAEVIAVANERLHPLFKINEERLDIFKQYCSAFDQIIEECEGEAVTIEVDEDYNTVKISIDCPDITIDTNRHVFYELAERANSLSFEKSEDDDDWVRADFVFPSLWEKAF